MKRLLLAILLCSSVASAVTYTHKGTVTGTNWNYFPPYFQETRKLYKITGYWVDGQSCKYKDTDGKSSNCTAGLDLSTVRPL